MSNSFNEDDNTDINDIDTEEEIANARKKNLKKRTIILSGVGVGIIIIALVISGVIIGNKGKEKIEDVPKNTDSRTENTTESVKGNIKENDKIDSWVAFEDELNGKYEKKSDSDELVVQGIQGKINKQQIKYTVNGYLKNSNIDVEVEMSYEYAEKLKVGNTFNVNYDYIEINNKRYVVGVYW